MSGLLGAIMPPWRMLGSVSNLLSGANGGFAPPLPHDPERDAAILAMLPMVPITGWTVQTLRDAAGPDADLLFPGGPAEMVEAHSELADRTMEQAGAAIAETRVSKRVRALLLLRLEQAELDRDAVRRGLSLLSLPGNRGAAVRSLARTVDTIWHAAGDQSADASWYSKRLLLAGVYSATLLYWLREGSGPATEAFLDRRLADVMRLGRLGKRRPLDTVRRPTP
ncbi:COQ9 family protein [Lichenicola sp.]|uniref:COQ9 family protein n=1 Tax=Lichenicola sp. TaxID=2804529 RepID=UPI003AFF79AA